MNKGKLTIAAVATIALAAAAFFFVTRPNDGERAVLAVLNDPSSAKFGKVFKAARGKNFWCGEVNAKNRMGGYVGMTRFVADADFIDYDGTADVTFESDPRFSGRWSSYCE